MTVETGCAQGAQGPRRLQTLVLPIFKGAIAIPQQNIYQCFYKITSRLLIESLPDFLINKEIALDLPLNFRRQ